MAWTQTDIDAVEAAIATAELRVKFADGREVEYRSILELLKARDAMLAVTAVADSSSGSRSTLATFRKD